MLKIRDKLTTPGTVYEQLIAWNDTVVIDGYFPISTLRSVGSYESIDSVYDGGFTPGKFRVNPVVIRQGSGYVVDGTMKYKGTATSCGKEHTVKGPYMGAFASMPTGGSAGSLVTNALAKAYAKTKDADVELFVMAGEFMETLELLRNPMKSLQRAFDKSARNASLWSRGLDAGSGGWLTFFYGIMPLIQDISSILELLSKQHGQIGGLQRKRKTLTSSDTTTSVVRGGYNSFAFDVSKVTTTDISVTAIVYYTLSMKHYSPWDSRVLGFSWPQLPGNLWELVRFSFVVDWILDVGSWLRNITVDPSVQHLGNCVSTKVTTKYTVTQSNAIYCQGPTQKGLTQFSPGSYNWTDEKLTRVTNLSPPVFPAFNNGLRKMRNLISSLALIWVNLPRNWRRR